MRNFLKDVDPQKLEAGMAQAQVFSKTPEGRALIEQLQGVDTASLLKSIESGNASATDIIGALSKNPEVMKALEKMMKQ